MVGWKVACMVALTAGLLVVAVVQPLAAAAEVVVVVLVVVVEVGVEVLVLVGVLRVD